jgi:hypothetical protein
MDSSISSEIWMKTNGASWMGQEQLETVLRQRLKAMDNEKEEVRLLLDAARKVEAQGPDAKAKALLEWIYRMQAEEQDPDLKVLIFTEFVPTQQMLAEFLQARGITVVCLNGSLALEERKAVQKQFSEEVRVMISTDAGGEGLNLQFCHVIINFDLGWRPMALEQRIGRLDRIGQKHIVKALNFLLEDSVEYRIQEVLETKLRVILEEFGVDKTTDLLDSVEGSRMFDRLFVEALLHPERASDEAERLAELVREEATENRNSRLFLSEPSPQGRDLDAVSSQPLGDLLEMLTRFHVEAGDGRFERQNDGSIRIQWPGEAEVFDASFPGALNGDRGGVLLNLDHPRIRGVLGRLPVSGKGEPIPIFAASGLPRSVDGTWSLWMLRLSSFDFNRARVFPVFVSRDGKSYATTARHVWERLPSLDLKLSGWTTGQESLQQYDELYQMATEEGRSLWQDMERQHRERWQEAKQKAQYHFTSRRRMLDQVGLNEVRGYRLRHLEADESKRMADLDHQRHLLPELEPLAILSIQAS